MPGNVFVRILKNMLESVVTKNVFASMLTVTQSRFGKTHSLVWVPKLPSLLALLEIQFLSKNCVYKVKL